MRTLYSLPLLFSAAVIISACSKKTETPEAPPAPAVAAETPAESAAAPASSTTEEPNFTSPKPPEGAKVFFVDLKDGDTVKSPVTVKFGAEGITLAPAGEDKPDTGHHHLVIDAELPPADGAVPSNEHYLHFGKAQTEATLELTPGKHTLQLSFANYLHVPFNPSLNSDKITITVK